MIYELVIISTFFFKSTLTDSSDKEMTITSEKEH